MRSRCRHFSPLVVASASLAEHRPPGERRGAALRRRRRRGLLGPPEATLDVAARRHREAVRTQRLGAEEGSPEAEATVAEKK